MSARPILLITGQPAHSPFAHYLPEILRIEGYLCCDSLDLRQAELSEADLEGVSVVLLGDVEVGEQAMGLLGDFARGGGTLIAMRPRHMVEELFGLRRLEGTYSQAADVYLCVNSSHPWMEGFPAQSFQFHGDADIYEPQCDCSQSPGEALASLAGQPDSPCSYPAVWTRQVGEGFAIAFAYDLAASVALTHQGVPREKAYDGNPDRDRDGMFKPNDFFIGYLDHNLRRLPQADLQQEILVRILRHASALPVPRVWYFPSPSGAAAVIRGDSDGMTREDYDKTLAIAEDFGTTYTIQMMEEHLGQFSREEVEALREKGHDVGIHPIFPLKSSVAEAAGIMDRLADAFEARYGVPLTSYVAHSCLFPGWADIPRHMERRGIALNLDFAAGRYLREGYLGGSGLPVRFVDEAGRLIDVFQQATVQCDDGYLGPKVLLELMDAERVDELTRGIIQDCLGFNTLYHACCHPVSVARRPRVEEFLRCILEELSALGIPTFGGHQWAEFNRQRRGLSVGVEELGAEEVRWRIEGTREMAELTVLLPQGEVECDGRPAATASLSARGQEWLAVPLSPNGTDSMEVRLRR